MLRTRTRSEIIAKILRDCSLHIPSVPFRSHILLNCFQQDLWWHRPRTAPVVCLTGWSSYAMTVQIKIQIADQTYHQLSGSFHSPDSHLRMLLVTTYITGIRLISVKNSHTICTTGSLISDHVCTLTCIRRRKPEFSHAQVDSSSKINLGLGGSQAVSLQFLTVNQLAMAPPGIKSQ